MQIDAPFVFRNQPTGELLALLEKTSLGTNGAVYRHLNTREIISQLDEPLFFSLERNGKILSNITFCRRNGNWYIRYFAFERAFQAGKQENPKRKKQGLLKRGIEDFFQQQLAGEVSSFYAYIDPKNTRSKAMCEHFGFQKIGSLRTQPFSRLKPTSSPRFVALSSTDEQLNKLKAFEKHLFFMPYQAKRLEHFALKDESGNVLASLSCQKAEWKIDRLPGKNGTFLVKILPFVPILNQFIRPQNHTFLVPECVHVKNNDPKLLEELFESLLAHYKEKIILWWADEREPLFSSCTRMNWGMLNRLLGSPRVDVVAKFNLPGIAEEAKNKLIFVSGMDLI